MTTDKQNEANRRNAQKSTGPRTPEGKARSGQNALKHGLTSRRMVLRDENEDAWIEFRYGVLCDLRPEGTLETQLAVRVAEQMWRLARVPAVEADLWEEARLDVLGGDDGLGAAWRRESAALSRLARYEAALQRGLTRLLGALRALQAERRKGERAEAGAARRPAAAEAPRSRDRVGGRPEAQTPEFYEDPLGDALSGWLARHVEGAGKRKAGEREGNGANGGGMREG